MPAANKGLPKEWLKCFVETFVLCMNFSANNPAPKAKPQPR